MQANARYGLALLAVLALASSGCVGDDGASFRGPTAVPLDAPSEIGRGDFQVQVKVIAEGASGEALVGAPIVIHHIPKPATAFSVQQLLTQNATLGGRTGPDGVLRANLDKGQTYTFLTGLENWTTEARHLVRITDEYRTKPVLIAVFKTAMTAEHKGKIPLTVRPDVPLINLQLNSGKWWPIEVRFHEDNGSNRLYLHRLHRFDATLLSTNDPGTYSNVFLRAVLSGDAGNPIIWESRGGTICCPPPTQNLKRLTLTPWDLANVAATKNPVLRIGPATYETAAGPACVPWELKIDMGFDTAPRPPPRKYTVVPPQDTVPIRPTQNNC